MPSQLGYWNIRGFAQPICLLLGYVGEDFEDVMYDVGEGPEYSGEQWLSVKYNLGLDFPNLPYYIDGDLRLTESYAILRHLGRKYNLYGETLKEKAQIDLLFDIFRDIRHDFGMLCYRPTPTFCEHRKQYIEQIQEKFTSLEKCLGDKKFFSSDQVTAIDFNVYEILDHHRILEPSIYDNFPKLKAFLKRFEELPAIKKFMKSDKFFEGPIYNKMAHFK